MNSKATSRTCGRDASNDLVLEHNTVMDFEPEEHRREMSVATGIGVIEHNKHKINLLDTPGHEAFTAMRSTLRAR